ncbi:MAG: hypothetical protein EU539_12370 [Promethearchaeota archaeon]|nr:MAG: hypothetical protein EU539_12370 [Candidatus Lokiarchaeota archaeon]
MKSNDVIIAKIGGKILEVPENLNSTIIQLKSLLNEHNKISKIILIPGGGSLANFIRYLDKKINLGDDLAHWSAIYAMEFNGMKICKQIPEIKCNNDFKNLVQFTEAENKQELCVFLPYKYLKKNDELAHSWDITSDSIAVYVAHKLNLNACFLIKNVDGIYLKNKSQVVKEIRTTDYIHLELSTNMENDRWIPESIKKSKPVDSNLTKLIDLYKIPCILLNGTKEKNRIIDFFDKTKPEKEKVYTKITCF